MKKSSDNPLATKTVIINIALINDMIMRVHKYASGVLTLLSLIFSSIGIVVAMMAMNIWSIVYDDFYLSNTSVYILRYMINEM